MDKHIVFASKCKEIRKKNETIRSISEKTNISTRCIADFENLGKSTLISMCKYTDALNCHLEIVPNDKKETQAPADPQNLTDAERVELDNLRRMKSIIKEVIK